MTFEFPDEGTSKKGRDRWRRAGVAVASGAALVSGGPVRVSADSLDVFDLAAGEPSGAGVDSPQAIDTAEPSNESTEAGFSPLDFSVSSTPADPALAGTDEIMFGAEASVGGGHTLDDAGLTPASEAFTAMEPEITPAEPLADFDDPDGEDDPDLTDLDFD